MGLRQTLGFITSHPLNRDRRLAAVARFAAWQGVSRVRPGPYRFRFVDDMRLNVSRGETGVTGNLYCGLHEFPEMGYALHFLRPGDLFVDVGANAGSYSVLAAAAGARVLAFEPAEAIARLRANLALNNIDAEIREEAVGPTCGTINFSFGGDVLNGVSETGTPVPMVSLDSLSLSPALIKIDAETFEPEVLKGAGATLERTAAVILESASACHETMTRAGFSPAGYDPLTRALTPLAGPAPGITNTIYVKDLEAASARLASARSFRVLGKPI